jgi:hypothetical protein
MQMAEHEGDFKKRERNMFGISSETKSRHAVKRDG